MAETILFEAVGDSMTRTKGDALSDTHKIEPKRVRVNTLAADFSYTKHSYCINSIQNQCQMQECVYVWGLVIIMQTVFVNES